MTSLRFICFSHLGRCGFRGSAGGSVVHSFAQCLVFPQRRQVSGVPLAFRAASMSIGTGLPGDGFEWANRGGGAAGTGRDITRGRFMDGVGG